MTERRSEHDPALEGYKGRGWSEAEPREIEVAALRAWPARERAEFDGWVARFADGYTSRANSVTPLDPDPAGLERRVERCESWYRARGRPPIFRLPEPTAPPRLDALLDRRGYTRQAVTWVMGREVAGTEWDAGAAEARALDEWLALFERLKEVEHEPRHRAILERIADPACFLVRVVGAEPVGCGLAVRSGKLVGLFDLITAPSSRRRGHGRALVGALLARGVAGGARYAYLQVEEQNTPARALYHAMGFESLYRYWYRVPPS